MIINRHKVFTRHLLYGKKKLQQIFAKLKELGGARFFNQEAKCVSHQVAQAFTLVHRVEDAFSKRV